MWTRWNKLVSKLWQFKRGCWTRVCPNAKERETKQCVRSACHPLPLAPPRDLCAGAESRWRGHLNVLLKKSKTITFEPTCYCVGHVTGAGEVRARVRSHLAIRAVWSWWRRRGRYQCVSVLGVARVRTNLRARGRTEQRPSTRLKRSANTASSTRQTSRRPMRQRCAAQILHVVQRHRCEVSRVSTSSQFHVFLYPSLFI